MSWWCIYVILAVKIVLILALVMKRKGATHGLLCVNVLIVNVVLSYNVWIYNRDN